MKATVLKAWRAACEERRSLRSGEKHKSQRGTLHVLVCIMITYCCEKDKIITRCES